MARSVGWEGVVLASNKVRIFPLSGLICIRSAGDSHGSTGSWKEWWTMVEVESMLALVEAVPEVVLIRSFESSSWSLVLVVESLLERRFLRMQRDRVDMKPILDFGDLVCVRIYVCGGGYYVVGCLRFDVDIDGAWNSW